MSRLGVVSTGRYKYYKLPIGCLDSAQTLRVNLVAVSGNPDLLLSTLTQKPTTSDFTLASTLDGSDELQIESPVSGIYYIGVYGQTSASFKLQATMDMYTGKHMCRTFRLEDVVLVEGEESDRVLLDGDFVVAGNASFEDAISVAGTAFLGDSMEDMLYLRSNVVVGSLSSLTSVIQRQTVQNIRGGDIALMGADSFDGSAGSINIQAGNTTKVSTEAPIHAGSLTLHAVSYTHLRAHET